MKAAPRRVVIHLVTTGLLRSAQAAKALGISKPTLWRWTVSNSHGIAAAQIRRGYYSTEKLTELGLLRRVRA